MDVFICCRSEARFTNKDTASVCKSLLWACSVPVKNFTEKYAHIFTVILEFVAKVVLQMHEKALMLWFGLPFA